VSSDRHLTYYRPRAVGLLAGAATGSLWPVVNVDLLRVVRTPKAVGIVVVVSHPKVAIMAVPRVAPRVGSVGASASDAVVVGLVRITAVVAIEIACQCCAKGSADNDTGNRRSWACTTPRRCSKIASGRMRAH